MTRARDLAFIRKMCSLGLPAQTLVHSLLPAVRQLVPAHSAGVFWVDADGEMSHLYAERLLPPDAMSRYHEVHYQKSRQGFRNAFLARASSADPVSFHSFTAEEQSDAYFRDVLHPLDAYHVLYGMLRNGSNCFAQVSLYRGKDDRPFDAGPAQTLRELLRYVEAGLGRMSWSPTSDKDAVMVEEHLGIVDKQGGISSGSNSWRRLLRLAALPRVSPRNAPDEQRAIELFLEDLCARANRPHGGREVDAYGVQRETPWGRFVLRCFCLEDYRGRRADHVGLLIRRDEPRSLALVRGAARAGLTPQQSEVALLLAGGMSNREISEAMGLTLNTASYHVKEVYSRLHVNDRGNILPALLEKSRLDG